ncbi:MAG TPA: acyltransferase [Ramlibacter sp.]|nr:acyltransferase [Ramlibacter sp.]
MPPHQAVRFEALDAWRGVCACFVVLFHFHGYSPIYTSALVRNSYLFVDFFFVLSGFVIAWNYSARLDSWLSLKRFLILRIGRLYPLHVFMLFCFVAYETVKLASGGSRAGGAQPFTGGTDPVAVLTNLLMAQSLNVHDMLTWNGPSWSISAEWWTYVLFAFVAVVAGVRNWLLAAVAIAAPLVLLRLTRTGMDVTYDWGLIRSVFGFALGVACCRGYRLLRPRTQRAGALHESSRAALATALEFAVLAAVVLFVSFAGKSNWSLLAPFVFSAAVLVFAGEGGAVSRLFRTRPLKWIGQLSYSIYLTHFLLVITLPAVLKRILHVDLWTPFAIAGGETVQLYGRDNVQGTLLYLLVLAITLAFSAFTYRWVETPGREWSRRWAGRPAAARAEPAPAGGGEVPSP